MAEEILASEILKKVVSIASQQIGAAWGVKGELKKIKESSHMIQAFLADAEKRQVEEESVKLWLKKLKKVYYDADDVLDEFEYELLRHKMETKNRFKAKVKNFFSPANPVVFRFKMAHKIKDINSTLAKIKNEMVTFRLSPTTNPIHHQHINDRKTTSHNMKVSKFVGREIENMAIVNQLIDSQNQSVDDVSVISVVGIGGLGKTALVQIVYNNKLVEEYFDLRIWVCVSEVFDIEKIFRDAIESITKTNCVLSNLDAIVCTFQKKISGKRFLFVLDDVWNEESAKWERFYALLGGGARRGSKLLVTTRSSTVASIVGPPATHFELQKLSEEKCWLLFKLWAFRERGAEETSNLVEIGKDIVRKCGGIPIAVMHLGCFMQSKKDEHEWLRIRNSKIWNLPQNQKIMGVLKLSYDNLLPPLKQCFSYCALFPKDSLINKNKLIQMWMAEGFFEPDQDMNGDDYFDILMYNSFFQDIEKDEFDRVCTFKMHDLVHDLAHSLSKSDFSYEVSERAQICRLSSAPETLKLLSATNKVRTYILPSTMPKCLVKLEFGSEFLKLKYLRVLDLHKAFITELPSFVRKLKHLRYLDLSETFIKTLPDFVCSLYNLQTLNLSFCEKLCELPKDMKKLIRLRHLAINGCTKLDRMPRDIRQLSSLQTFSKFIVGEEDSGCSIRELKCLKLGGELEIQKLEMVRSGTTAKEANLDQKPNIQALKLCWSENCGVNYVDDVLEGLRPDSSLKKLEVWRFWAKRWPTWMNANLVPDLVEIHLCYSSCEHLPPFGQLKYLRLLEIAGMGELRCIGDEFYGDIGTQEVGCNLFPSLRKLFLLNLRKLEEWMEPPKNCNSCFPMLETLYVWGCYVLAKTPSQFPSLKKLDVKHGSESLVRSLSCKVSSLALLHIRNIDDIKYLPQGLLQRNNLLQKLILYGCPEIRSIPGEELRHLKSLGCLELYDCKSLTVEPDLMSCLTSLHVLMMVGVKEMNSTSLAEWVCNLPLLDNLGIGRFADEPDVFPMTESIEQIISLRALTLCGWPKLTTLPEQLQHLTRLRGLEIMDFEDLVALPNWLTNLPSLKYFGIVRCEKLKYLPENFSSFSIPHLRIRQCPLLKERCTSVTGEEWPKIAHIPLVEFKDLSGKMICMLTATRFAAKE